MQQGTVRVGKGHSANHGCRAPHLEYCVQHSSHHLRKDVNTSEKVYWINPENRRFFLFVKFGEVRLVPTGVRGDLIQTFKPLRGIERVDIEGRFLLFRES